MTSYKFNKCINCNKVKRQSTSCTGKYCSNLCQVDYQFEQRFLEWYYGEGKHSNPVMKDFISLVHGYHCSVCGISSWNEKQIVLELEHKDGNSENNHPTNLCLICPNCHSQTDTYKGKNKGNGRHSRRLRYQEGLSY